MLPCCICTSDAFSSKSKSNKNESLEKELGRLVMPAFVDQAVSPVAQLLETAWIGSLIGNFKRMDGLKNQENGLVSLIPGGEEFYFI